MNNEAEGHSELNAFWQRVLIDDERALAALHAQLFPDLFHYASNLLQDEEAASDALQELFIKVWSKRSQIGEIKHVKAYFFTLLRRQLLNHLRNTKQRELKILSIGEPDITFSQEDILIKNEQDRAMKEKIKNALNALPTRQKEVIYFKYFDDLDYKEIAGIMEINYQSVVNLAYRAVQTLQEKLVQNGPLIFLNFFLKRMSI